MQLINTVVEIGKMPKKTLCEQVLTLCDKYFPGDPPEYFFDVSWVGFNSILDVYRCGALHLTAGVCALVTKKDLEYWGVDELLLEPCCALKYYPEIELCVKEIQGEEQSRAKQQVHVPKTKIYGVGCYNRSLPQDGTRHFFVKNQFAVSALSLNF